MERKISIKAEQELKFKRDWCLTIAKFIEPYYPKIPNIPTHAETIEATFKKGFLMGMRMLYNDMNEGAEALTSGEICQLNKTLREKFGQDLNTVNKKLQKKALTIIKRGAIKNDEEFYQMKPFIDYLLWTGDSQDEENARELDRILCEYEQNSHPH